MASLLFAIATHPLIIALQHAAQGGLIKGLVLPNDDQLLIKMFEDDSLLFLQADSTILRNALQIVQDFAVASGSMCNIEKSRLLSIVEDNSFDPSAWIGEIVPKGVVVRHLGAPIGIKQAEV